jgi:hypothetical protein
MIVDYEKTSYRFDLPELLDTSNNSFITNCDKSLYLHPDYPFNLTANIHEHHVIMLNDGNIYYGVKESGIK